jgi:hypothetical protein
MRIESDAPRPEVVGSLLRDLPEWFGIEEAIREYVTRAADLPTYTASVDGEPAGVLVLEHHNDQVAEIRPRSGPPVPPTGCRPFARRSCRA